MSYMRMLILILIIFFLASCNTPFATSTEIAKANTPTATSTAIVFATSKPTVMPTSTVTLRPSPSPTPLTDQIYKFEGKVSRNQIYEQLISQDLYFRLRPIDKGWVIWIGKKAQPSDNYVSIVSLPHYGRVRAWLIEGWHFRNSDNTGPNEPGEKLVNAPQKERRFSFIVNEKEYEIAYKSLNEQLFPKEEYEKALTAVKKLKLYDGKLTITKIDLGNLVPGEEAWIESMEFEVELDFPTGFR